VSVPDRQQWLSANQQYLAAQIARMRLLLQAAVSGETVGEELAAAKANIDQARRALPADAALDVLAVACGLSPFETDLLMLLAAIELDGGCAELSAGLQSHGLKQATSFAQALACLPEGHWNALAPNAPLRYWRLLEIGPGDTLTQSPLRLAEWALHFVIGSAQLDPQLQGVLSFVAPNFNLTPSQADMVADVQRLMQQVDGRGSLPVIQLCGDSQSAQQVAATACAGLQHGLFRMDVEDLPPSAVERDSFIRLWQREVLLHGCVLFLVADELDDPEQSRRLRAFLAHSQGGVIVALRNALSLRGRRSVNLKVPHASSAEQRMLWQQALGAKTDKLNGDVERLVNQFRLEAQDILDVGATVGGIATDEAVGLKRELWEACRRQARPRLDELAQKIDSRVCWSDLVLPELQMQTLNEISAQVRQRVKVYEEWGFAGKNDRGMGVAALFHGPSGTGKTLAAEVLANELQLDLYRIDLSTVVNKYIGETEKNLRRIFDAAESGGVILLFDEADALFGKRSEVKDSHDRYANIEVSYLLQRMETYRGLAILTSNQKQALDTAFLRRLRFVVQFPFPDTAQRAEIWRRVFPSQTPTEALDVQKLSRLNVAGGHIRNIALNAAFLAADRGHPLGMADLRDAARTEYAKLEKPLSAELRDWI
jgi:hypothetical protein